VRVAFDDGSPAVGSRVELLENPDAVALSPDVGVLPPSTFLRAAERPSLPMLRAETETDETGRSVLTWPAAAGPYALRVRGPSHFTTVVEEARLEAGGTVLDVAVTRGATVRGSLRPLAVLDRLVPRGAGELALTHTGEAGLEGRAGRRKCPVDEGGSFELSGLAPGTWTVQLRGVDGFAETLDTLELAAGETREVERDHAHQTPASISGRQRLDGAPAANDSFLLLRVVDWEDGASAYDDAERVSTDEDGAFEAAGLRPGRYVAAHGRRETRLFGDEAVEVGPGGRATAEFRLDGGQLLLRLVDGEGAPLARASCRIQSVATGAFVSAHTDEDGVLDRAVVPGRYSIRVRGRWPDRASYDVGEVVVPAGPASAPTERIAPPR
jgi:hypothetical protein